MHTQQREGDRIDWAVQLRGLRKIYGDSESVVAVDSLDLEIEAGEIFGFLGPNGAGKSTTLNMLLGFTSPTAGEISIRGLEVKGNTTAIREQIGVLPEGLGLYERLSGRRHLEFAIEWKDADDDPDTLLDRVALDRSDALRPVGEYSKGMQQRLALAMALVGNPRLILLDEPSSGLDPHGIRRLRDIIREERDRGATVVFSSHILGQVEAVCDRVGILHGGTLVAVDTIEGLRKTVGSGTELQLRMTDAPTIDLTQLSGVARAEFVDGILRVQTDELPAKARVVEELTRSGATILDINSSPASLENVFTSYTTSDPASTHERPAESSQREVIAE